MTKRISYLTHEDKPKSYNINVFILTALEMFFKFL